MRSALGCATLGLLLLLVAGTFDAEPLYVTGSALLLLGAGAAAWIAAGAWGATVRRELDTRSVVEEQPLSMRIEANAGRMPLPPGWIDEPLLPEPVRFTAGRRRARVRVEVTFGRRGRRLLAAARARPARPLRPRPAGRRGRRARRAARAPAHPAGAGDGGRGGRRLRACARRPDRRRRDRDRRAAPAPRGRARLAHPLAGVARGAGLMERKLISEADSRPLVVLDPRAPRVARGARRRRARRRLARRPLRQARRLRAAAAG